jgi:acyl-coenzyme A thioesterase PaaI-like protein
MPDGADVKLEMCFGCGAGNPRGLHIEYGIDPDGASSTTMSLSEELSGEPGLVHGGIQAVILDEVMGRAAQRAATKIAGAPQTIVTASFSLRYRTPCPTGVPVTARGLVDRVEWPSVFVAGTLTDQEGLLLTEATARWRVLDDSGHRP